jgi:hypothetical protein
MLTAVVGIRANMAMTALSVGILLCVVHGYTATETDYKAALQLITETADKICKDIPLEGHGQGVELSGQAKAELSKLVKSLADIGIQGAGKYTEEAYRGVIQKDLTQALKMSTDCKLTVWNDLKRILLAIPERPPPPDPKKHIQTKYPGIVARITRFGTSGSFVILEITVMNISTGTKGTRLFSLLQFAELTDQQTGDSWRPTHTGGTLGSRNEELNPSQETGGWMQFRIPNPENRVFLLNSDLFNRPVENLVIGTSP